MPCNRRNITICSIECARPHSNEAKRETGDADQKQPLAPKAVGEPADRRGEDRRRDDVGRQHPVDLIDRGGQRTLHVGQRDVRHRGVERLHDRSPPSRRPSASSAGTGFLMPRRRARRSFRALGDRLRIAEQRAERAVPARVDIDGRAHAGAQLGDVLVADRARCAPARAARP